jgi:hypothetical protein
VAAPPEAELIAIRVDQIGKRLEFLPLLLVVTVLEPAGIGTLAGSLDFDEPDERVLHGDRVVRAHLELGH